MHHKIHLDCLDRNLRPLQFLPNVPVDKRTLACGVISNDHHVELLLGCSDLAQVQLSLRQCPQVLGNLLKSTTEGCL